MNALLLARIQARELLRRRLAFGLLVGMPLAFYLVTFATEDPAQPSWSAGAGAIGMGFAIAGAAFFAMLAARGVDPRLVLAGWRPGQLIFGRLLLLEVVAVLIGVGFVAVMWPLSHPPHPAGLVLAIATTAAVSVPIGLAVAALLPRELEGILVVIIVIGIQMSVRPDSAAGRFTPLYGPAQLSAAATNGGDLVAPVLHAFGCAAALLVVAVLAWRRRLRIRKVLERAETVTR